MTPQCHTGSEGLFNKLSVGEGAGLTPGCRGGVSGEAAGRRERGGGGSNDGERPTMHCGLKPH